MRDANTTCEGKWPRTTNSKSARLCDTPLNFFFPRIRMFFLQILNVSHVPPFVSHVYVPISRRLAGLNLECFGLNVRTDAMLRSALPCCVRYLGGLMLELIIRVIQSLSTVGEILSPPAPRPAAVSSVSGGRPPATATLILCDCS